ncbi:MAG: hypothetical protein ICV59_08720 [Thermoleophilia bacterium]|nr:hypothetical protein [Thermoleophilia bacterium]
MPRSAPRYDPVIDRLVSELDDPSESMAEICRRVAQRAQALGLTRPSLVHLRTLVRAERDRREAERDRREALREVVLDAATKSIAGLVPDPYTIIERLSEPGHTDT